MCLFGEFKNRINCWMIRRILKSALIFEPDSYNLYISIKDAVEKSLAGSRADIADMEDMTDMEDNMVSNVIAALDSLINQEKLHEELIREIKGEMECSGLKKALKRIPEMHLTNIGDIMPLGRIVDKSISLKINEAVEQEEDSFKFYMNLYRMSKIGSVKEAFSLLADQESIHLILLKKLMGKDRF